jgi:isopentenyl-diphosphate delta-isomerase
MEKMEAHRIGVLHRAFSVFIFNRQGEMMLQQRAFSKYHSPGLWTNACCSHPRDGETVIQAGIRRLHEEMGFTTPWRRSLILSTRLMLPGLTEHELDHVLVGRFDDTPQLNPEEVADWKWISLEALQMKMIESPEEFTVWFRIALPELLRHLDSGDQNG